MQQDRPALTTRARRAALAAGVAALTAIPLLPADAARAAVTVLPGTVTVPLEHTRSGARTVYYTGIDLAGGYLYTENNYYDTGSSGGAFARWRRKVVTDDDGLAFGPRLQVGPAGSSGMAFTAGRGLVDGSGWEFDEVGGWGPALFLDRGVEVASVRAAEDGGQSPRQLSGPYATVYDSYPQVLRADGVLLFTLPADRRSEEPVIFGSRTFWLDGAGALRMRDLAAAPPTTQALDVDACPCRSVDSAWGDLVAMRVDDTHVVVYDVAADTQRVVTVPEDAIDVQLSDGVLAWSIVLAGGLRALDLTDPGSTPVTVTSAHVTEFSLDDGQVAWVDSGSDRVSLADLGFGGESDPRLLGAIAPGSLSPDGDGVADRWEPEFDATTGLRGVQLTISSGGSTVRTLGGSGRDGSVRDLLWDGRDGDGDVVANGTYTWRLTATDADGNALRAVDGVSQVTGTVRVGPAGYQPVRQKRILDTSKGLGAPDAPLGAGKTLDLAVTGAGLAPADAAAVVMSVSALKPSSNTSITAFPAGSARPPVSNLQTQKGRTATTTAVLAPGAGGKITLWNRAGTADVVAELVGWFGAGGPYHPLTPTAVFDTRTGLGGGGAKPTGPDTPPRLRTFPVLGQGGVPGNAGAAMVELTAIDATKDTTIALDAPGATADTPRTLAAESSEVTSTLGLAASTLPSGATKTTATTNTFAGSTDLFAATTGWFAAGPQFGTVAPGVAADTKRGIGIPGTLRGWQGANVRVGGSNGVPASGLVGLLLNVTVSGASNPGAVVLRAQGTPEPVPARSVSFTPGVSSSSMVVSGVSPNGSISVSIGRTDAVDVAITVVGYLTA